MILMSSSLIDLQIAVNLLKVNKKVDESILLVQIESIFADYFVHLSGRLSIFPRYFGITLCRALRKGYLWTWKAFLW